MNKSDPTNSVVADLHVKDEAYMVMHEHVVKNRFPNIVGSFDQKIISKLHQLSQETSSIINPAATDRTSHTVSRPLSTPKGRLVADKNIDVKPDRNESFLIPVHLFNESDETWHTNGSHPVHLSYHWMDAKSNHVVFDGIRTKLKCGSLPPGCTTEEVIHIQAPDKPGDYKLALTLVQEGVCWFEDRGFTCQFLNLSVK